MTLACGKRIPASEHAVSLSLPTLRDVIGYEEKSDAVFRHVCSGYPRFVRHWTVEQVEQHLQKQFDAKGPVITLHDPSACHRLMRFVDRELKVLNGLPFGAVELPEGESSLVAEAQRFQQHTGLMLSSRQAEDYLVDRGLLDTRQPEADRNWGWLQAERSTANIDLPNLNGRDAGLGVLGTGTANSERLNSLGVVSRACGQRAAVPPDEHPVGKPHARAVRQCLAGIYGVSENVVSLYPSGMNAYFSIFETLNGIQNQRGREQWLQVGWLYLDTTAILDRFASRQHRHFAIGELSEIEAYVAANHSDIAGITTEVMTNPLMQTPDLERLSKLARRFDLPLIVDISMPTPVNVNVFPYADVCIESLTKFASGHADVMAGVAVFNGQSTWGKRLCDAVPVGTPYYRDLQRLAHNIQGYTARMAAINANTSALIAYFRVCDGVRSLYWAGQPDSSAAYANVRRPSGGDGGVLSIVFKKPLQKVYDRLDLLKGPSFGTEFTLCMAYVYMAHYDLVKTSAGRKRLHHEGLDPELLRISVGVEPIDDLIRAFEKAL